MPTLKNPTTSLQLIMTLFVPAFLTACTASYHVASDTTYPHEEYASVWCDEHQSYHEDVQHHNDTEVIIEHEVYHEPARPARSGFTACGNFMADRGTQNTCQPGQYCADDTFSTCSAGCLSDTNCASNQACVKDAGLQVGVCQNLDYYGAL